MISFERIDVNTVPWDQVTDIDGVNVFQTLPWLDFLQKNQKVEPVVVVVKSDGLLQGYFMGLITKKYGLKILGSPFRGWGTYFMGFSLKPEVSHREVLQAFPQFVFGDLKCHYFEIIDPNLKSEEWEGLSYQVEHLPWYALDVSKSEDELFATMKHACRNCIRKAIKSGVVIEEATDPGFADEYYAQYQEVMARQSLAPTYGVEFVRQMIEHLLPTGNLFLLRARNAEGICIATGIFLFLNKTAVFWGAASLREHQALRPNELLAWYGMKKVKARETRELHLGGECDHYKEKFGSYDAQMFRLSKAKTRSLEGVLKMVLSLKNPNFRNWMLRKM
jgi:hypothetical protein